MVVVSGLGWMGVMFCDAGVLGLSGWTFFLREKGTGFLIVGIPVR